VPEQRQHVIVPPELAGLRLDQALSELFQAYSRSRLQTWIRNGRILVNGRSAPIRYKMMGGEQIELTPELTPETDCEGQDIPLSIVYEDSEVLVVDKPAGVVVHPAAGHPDGTLQNALLYHAPTLKNLPRSGIVHRIDKDTSGLLMVAKTLQAHKSLVDQLQARETQREYLAIAQGYLTAGATIDEPLGRHPTDRKRYSVRRDGKDAVTHYRIAERLPGHTLLRIKLETGRTHQIRVHMAHIHHPLLGDPVYGGRLKLPAGAGSELVTALRAFRRQALHAETLGFEHPESGEWMEWHSELPEDMQDLLQVMRSEAVDE
jgi:23S rRNA pseudouridine1911/1915/1917 synthase